jgi:hypothetical protein
MRGGIWVNTPVHEKQKRKTKMKKLLMFIVATGLAIASQAAVLDWQYTATSADVGQTVYVLLGSTAVQEWESVDKLSSAAVGNGKVAKAGRNFLATGKVENDAITKESADVYYVVVSSDGSTFSVTSVSDMTGSVYDPNNQESTPGNNTSLSSSSITKSGIAWGTGGGGDPDPGPGGDVPEPTSGILLMIGGAALALRRRR